MEIEKDNLIRLTEKYKSAPEQQKTYIMGYLDGAAAQAEFSRQQETAEGKDHREAEEVLQ